MNDATQIEKEAEGNKGPVFSIGVSPNKAILFLKDGQALSAEEVLKALQEREELFKAYKALDDLVVKEYGWSFGKYSTFADAYDELKAPACMPENPDRY